MTTRLPTLPAWRAATAFTLALALGACTNIHNDRTRTTTEGGLTGAAGGALVGAGAGALAGGKNKKNAMLAGAAAGAVVGGAAGTAYGAAVAQKKAGYAQTEDELGAQLHAAQRELSDRHTFNLGLKYEIERQQARLAALQAPGHALGRVVEEFELRSTLSTRLGELEREARSWQVTIDAHKAALRQAGSDPRAAALQTEIAGLKTEQAELDRQRKEMVSIGHRAK